MLTKNAHSPVTSPSEEKS